jgi:drug/metabolite transporter (DMT)-like permease
MFNLTSQEGGTKLVASFLAVYLLWGSAFLAIRFSLSSFPPLLMAGLRFFIAGVVLYLWARICGSGGATGRQWLKTVIIGFLLFAIGNGGIVLAAVFLPSGLVSLMVAAIPVYLVLLDWLLTRKIPGVFALVGLVAGALGMVLLFGPSIISGGNSVPPLGMILAIIAPLAWVLGSLYTRHADLPQSQLQVAGMEMFAGGVILLVTSFFWGETAGFYFEEVTVKSWLALLYLIVFCSIVGFSSYIYILKAATPVRVATYAYVNPVVALFLGWLVVGEIASTQTILGSAVLLCAVCLLSRSSKTKQLQVEP